MPEFELHSPFQPTGDQPEAIAGLVEGLNRGDQYQTLLGATGTGKTYTIALLFLRLLLEKGLSVDEILVVTFTKAATEELRGRIRQRIRDALDVLEGQGPDDPLLQDLLAKATERIPQDKASILLSDALTRMDEAAIYTIHGFCQRMLRELAFETGSPFDLALTGDDLEASIENNLDMLSLPNLDGTDSVTPKRPLLAMGLIGRAAPVEIEPVEPAGPVSQVEADDGGFASDGNGWTWGEPAAGGPEAGGRLFASGEASGGDDQRPDRFHPTQSHSAGSSSPTSPGIWLMASRHTPRAPRDWVK